MQLLHQIGEEAKIEWETERQKLWVSLVRKQKKPRSRESEEKGKSNQCILCKSVQRSYLRENVLFLILYFGVRYPPCYWRE